MATNVTEKDKTLQEVIDWCSDWAKELCADILRTLKLKAEVNQ